MIESNDKKDYLASIQTSYTIKATGELWYAMTHLAQVYIQRGSTQIGADILVFVLIQDDVSQDVYDLAFDLFDDLERSICPRVIWDAKVFASEMDLEGMIDYLLGDVDNSS